MRRDRAIDTAIKMSRKPRLDIKHAREIEPVLATCFICKTLKSCRSFEAAREGVGQAIFTFYCDACRGKG